MPERRALAALLRLDPAAPPTRARARALPFSVERLAARGTRSRPWSRRRRPGPTTTRPGSAADCSRAAVLTASPVSMRSRGPLARSRSTSTSPASTPTRIASCGLPSAANAPVQLGQHRLHLERRADGALGVVLVRPRHAEHRQHRVAHELLEQPAVARRSPRVSRSNARPTTDWTTSGSSRSASEVDPTRSANSAVANFRSRRRSLGLAERLPHCRQNRACSGFSSPQRGQVCIATAYPGRRPGRRHNLEEPPHPFLALGRACGVIAPT